MHSVTSIPFGDTSFAAYYTYPDDGQKHPGVLLVHDVWGLDDHIKDVAERFVNDGYIVLAPDLISQTDIAKKIDHANLVEKQEKLREAMAPLSSSEFGKETIAKLKACLDYLENDEHTSLNFFAVGFGFGGTCTYALAIKDARPTAVVSFYGYFPQNVEEVKNIACPILAFYGEKDTKLLEQLPQLEEKMLAYEKDFRYIVYSNTGYAFFNDKNVSTYNKDAADDAWAKTLAFLEEQLTKP